jgi:LuxR family maltose regulon positive regulatory protein
MVASGLAARARGDHDAARVHIGDARSMVLSCADPGPVVASLVKKAEGRMPMTRGSAGVVSPLIADFSEREIDVLRLLGGALSQREIGDVLFISFNTVKTHSKSIYRKLGVGQRLDAVARARELDLI